MRRMWPTPKHSDGIMGLPRTTGRGIDKVTHLATAAKFWPTPNCSNSTGSGEHGDGGVNLQTAVATYSTTSCGDYRTGYRLDSEAGMRQREMRQKPLRDQVAPGGQLSPNWVEWLMGWPTGWTAIDGTPITFYDWSVDPADTGEIPRTATGIKNRVQRLKTIGNGQVPACFATAWEILSEIITQLLSKEDTPNVVEPKRING